MRGERSGERAENRSPQGARARVYLLSNPWARGTARLPSLVLAECHFLLLNLEHPNSLNLEAKPPTALFQKRPALYASSLGWEYRMLDWDKDTTAS